MMTHVECMKTIVKLNLKKALLKSSLFDYSDAYIHAKTTVGVSKMAAAAAATSIIGKKVIFKNCAEFTG